MSPKGKRRISSKAELPAPWAERRANALKTGVFPVILGLSFCFLPAVFADYPEAERKASELNNSAIEKFQGGDLDGAELDLLQALAYASEHPSVKKNLGSVYFEKGVHYLEKDGRPDASVRYLEKSLEIEPLNTRYRSAYAAALFVLADQKAAKGDVRAATFTYEKGLHYDPQNPMAWLKVSDFAWQTQQTPLALALFEEAERLAPSNEQVLKLKSKIERLKKESFLETIESEHFILSLQKERLDAIGKTALLDFLENAYRELNYRMRGNLPPKVTVVFYSRNDFHSSLDVPDHVTGFYDGKMRLPLPPDAKSLPGLTGAVQHELTHALLHHLSPGQTWPLWFSEGLAQWGEKRELTSEHLRVLSDFETWSEAPGLDMLDKFVDRKNRWAYLKSFAVFDFLVRRHGIDKVLNFVKKGLEGGNFERLFAVQFGNSPGDLEYSWKNELLNQVDAVSAQSLMEGN